MKKQKVNSLHARVFEKFKILAGGIGEVYERTAEVAPMPEDMMPGQDQVPAADGDMVPAV